MPGKVETCTVPFAQTCILRDPSCALGLGVVPFTDGQDEWWMLHWVEALGPQDRQMGWGCRGDWWGESTQQPGPAKAGVIPELLLAWAQ